MANDPLWYKDAIVYQLHVKAYLDSSGDGIGDFAGLTRKLDYLTDLGVTAIWLLPFYPSPLRDDGYDIADYMSVNPAFGTLRDFRYLVREAHRRGLKVITELVINHTSDQHPWFQRARKAPADSRFRNYYVWSDSDQKYDGTRIIFCDTEKSNWSWDPEAKAYYWHRFFSHQPDLNFDNPRVFVEVTRIMRFWLDMGVDGLRLDAVPYLVEREGTNNENLPETHAVLKRLRQWLDDHYPDRMFLAEANQWPEDVLPYFGNGDECHMAFHFPLMPRMYMALAREDRYPITDIMRQTPDIPESCQWALFLRNHDELTLEMVTDSERDYLWQFYAAEPRARINLGIRRRLAPLLEGDRRKIELLNSLLMSMPGTPIIYYGDEIGMGDNIFLGDRNGVRTPMQWSPDRNAGFSRADPERLYLPPVMDSVYGYEAINVEAQLRQSSSLLNWTRRLLTVRKAHQALGRGTLTFLYPRNRKVLAYLRADGAQTVLCVANMSSRAAVGRARPLGLQEPRAGRIAGPQRVPADRRPALLRHHAGLRFLLVSAGGGGGGAEVARGLRHAAAGIPHAGPRPRLEQHHRSRQRHGALAEHPARLPAEPALVRRQGAAHSLGLAGGRGRIHVRRLRFPDRLHRRHAGGRVGAALLAAAHHRLGDQNIRSAGAAAALHTRPRPAGGAYRCAARRDGEPAVRSGRRAWHPPRPRDPDAWRRPHPLPSHQRAGGDARVRRAAGRAAGTGAEQHLRPDRRGHDPEGAASTAAGHPSGGRDRPLPHGCRRLQEHAADTGFRRDHRRARRADRHRRPAGFRAQSGRRLVLHAGLPRSRAGPTGDGADQYRGERRRSARDVPGAVADPGHPYRRTASGVRAPRRRSRLSARTGDGERCRHMEVADPPAGRASAGCAPTRLRDGHAQ